jgi:hypothetical protein
MYACIICERGNPFNVFYENGAPARQHNLDVSAEACAKIIAHVYVSTLNLLIQVKN